MRDDKIYQMHEANVRRTLLLLSQFEFLQTKMQAYEEVLSSTRARLLAVFNPEMTNLLVERRQLELLAERKEEFKKAAAMPRIVKVSGNGVG